MDSYFIRGIAKHPRKNKIQLTPEHSMSASLINSFALKNWRFSDKEFKLTLSLFMFNICFSYKNVFTIWYKGKKKISNIQNKSDFGFATTTG